MALIAVFLSAPSCIAIDVYNDVMAGHITAGVGRSEPPAITSTGRHSRKQVGRGVVSSILLYFLSPTFTTMPVRLLRLSVNIYQDLQCHLGATGTTKRMAGVALCDRLEIKHSRFVLVHLSTSATHLSGDRADLPLQPTESQLPGP